MGCLNARPHRNEWVGRFAVEAVATAERLHLEYVLSTPLASVEGEVELFRTENRLHHAIHEDLVTDDKSVTVRCRFVPLDGDVAEVTRPAMTSRRVKKVKS